jgi:hypothetical protein
VRAKQPHSDRKDLSHDASEARRLVELHLARPLQRTDMIQTAQSLGIRLGNNSPPNVGAVDPSADFCQFAGIFGESSSKKHKEESEASGNEETIFESVSPVGRECQTNCHRNGQNDEELINRSPLERQEFLRTSHVPAAELAISDRGLCFFLQVQSGFAAAGAGAREHIRSQAYPSYALVNHPVRLALFTTEREVTVRTNR